MTDLISTVDYYNILHVVSRSNPNDIGRLDFYLSPESPQSKTALKCLFSIEKALFPDDKSQTISILQNTEEVSQYRRIQVADLLDISVRSVTRILADIGHDIVLFRRKGHDVYGLSICVNFNRPPINPKKEGEIDMQKLSLAHETQKYELFLNVLEKIRRFYKLSAFEPDVAFHEMYID